jgi:hypothetical protein
VITTTKKIEVQTNQHHPSLLPRGQQRYLHHLVPQGEMIIKITTIVVGEGGDEIVGTLIFAMVIVAIGDDEEVTIDMTIWIEEETIIVMIIVIRMTG